MKTHSRRWIGGAALVGVALLSVAQASRVPGRIREAEAGLWVGAGMDFQRDTQTVNGATLDSQNGMLGAYMVGFTGMSRFGEGLYWQLRYLGADGVAPYQGDAALGVPAQASLAQAAFNLNGRLGIVVDDLWRHERSTVLIPYLGLGFHRGVQSPRQDGLLGVQRRSSAGHWGLGLRGDYVVSRRWVVAVHALAGFSFGAQVTATEPVLYNSTQGTMSYGDVTETVGDRLYSSLGATLIYRVYRRWHVSLHVERTQWSYKAPAPLTIPTQTGATFTHASEPGGSAGQTLLMLEASRVF